MTRPRLLGCLAVVLALCGLSNARGSPPPIKDAESATHVDAAAEYRIVNTYEYPGFKIVQFTLPVLSHYSYILLSGKDALVVDPGRDIDAYMDYLREHELNARGVLLTHSHADFVAGHIEMTRTTGCPIYASASAGAAYEHDPVKEGSEIIVGEAVVRVVETPGHTPDGVCGYVFSGQEAQQLAAIFTGDTLFVGSIGRPDLLEGKITAASLASMAYDTWHNKLSKLGDEVVILPAHGAGSLCGAHLRDEPFSTIGTERASNPYFQHPGRHEFIAAVLEGLPEAPQYFSHNAAMNREGPPPVNWDAALPPEVEPSRDLLDPEKFFVVDLRGDVEYASGHIPNSLNVALRGRFESWVGRMVPWGVELVLYGSVPDLKEALHRLHRVGYTARVLTVESYTRVGLPVAQVELTEPRKLYEQMAAGSGPIIVDVRLPEEWMGLRIGTVVNMPLDRLAQLSAKLDPMLPTMTVCNSAYRSSMGVGVLERRGFSKLYNLAGGAEAWVAAGLPVFGAVRGSGAETKGAAGPKRDVRLADRLSSGELQRMMMDLPGSFDLVDIRPPQHFADYSLPASSNVDIAELLANPAYLTGPGPLIVVDRDGSLAMMVAGILSQKTQRSVKALYGGLQAYWADSTVGTMANVPGQPPTTMQPPISTPRPAAPAQPVPGQPKPPAKKSAGC